MAEKEDLGATGTFPNGKLNEHDEGGLQLGVTVKDNILEIHFGKKVAWLGLPKKEAQAFVDVLQKRINTLK